MDSLYIWTPYIYGSKTQGPDIRFAIKILCV